MLACRWSWDGGLEFAQGVGGRAGDVHRLGWLTHMAMHRAVPLACRRAVSRCGERQWRHRFRADVFAVRDVCYVDERGGMDIRSGQKLAWENKVAKGFNTTDVPLEFCLLQGEVAEAFDAWRKGRVSVGEELADVAIYLLGLAEMTGVDLQQEVEVKIARNAARVYQSLPNGVLVKDGTGPER